ncbi:MAG: hypothetical protein QM793_13620 [Muricomes sp.]
METKIGKKGILVVSFGTSHMDALEDNIIPIETQIQDRCCSDSIVFPY